MARFGRGFLWIWILTLVSIIACGQSDSLGTEPEPTASNEVATSVATESASASVSTLAEPGIGIEGVSVDLSTCPNSEGFCHPRTMNGFGDEPQYGGIATLAHRRDFPGTDPMFTQTVSLMGAAATIFNQGNLVRAKRANTFEWEPALATSWDLTDDGKTWTFKIRPDVKWHDGTYLTAEHIKYWIDLHTNPPEGRRKSTGYFRFQDLNRVEVVDPMTVQLIMNSPAPNLLETLHYLTLVVASPPWLVQPEFDLGNFKVQPNDYGWVGLGPFVYKEYKQGSLFQVRRFDGYWEEDSEGRSLPYLDGIDFVIIRDRGVTVNAFRAGRLESTSRGLGFFLGKVEVDAIQRDFGDKAYFTSNPYLAQGIVFNSMRPPFDDVRLRRAVHLFIDRADARDYLFGGFGYSGALYTAGSPASNPDLDTWPGYDPATKEADRAEALRLLDQGSWDGLEVALLCRENMIALCEYHDGQLRMMGLDSKIDVVDTNLWNEKIAAGNYEFSIGAMIANHPSDPRIYETGNPYSDIKHGDLRIDEFMDRIDRSFSQDERIELARELERYMAQDNVYFASSLVEPAIVAWRTHFKGYWTPTYLHSFNVEYATAWLDR